MSDKDPVSSNFKRENEDLHLRFDFRCIRPDEAEQGIAVEQACFPPQEACSWQHMQERIDTAANLFYVAVERSSGRIAGMLNGLATDEEQFRDEFFTDISLYRPEGKVIMILGLAVLPEYRRKGLAKELMREYIHQRRQEGRHRLILTCLDSRVPMYKKFGFTDEGISESTWGGQKWHEMTFRLQDKEQKEN